MIFSLLSPTIQLFSYMVGFVVLLLLLSQQTRHTAVLKALSVTLWFLICVAAGSYVLGRASLPIMASLFLSAALFAPLGHLKEKGTQSRPAGGRRVVEGEGAGAQQNKSQSPQLEGDDGGDSLTLEGPSEPAIVPRVSFSQDVKEGGGGGGVDEVDGRRMSRESWPRSQHQSRQLFLVLIASCFFVSVWKYPLFLVLLLLPVLLCAGLKQLVLLPALQRNKALGSVMAGLSLWLSAQRSVLVPEPLPTLLVALHALDRRALQALKPYIGSLVSACILMGLLLSACAVMVLLMLELRAELSHYATVTAAVWKSALASQPWLAKWGCYMPSVGH